MSKAEWTEAWSVLKESGAYEYRLGDLVLPGIAHCTRKDVLIFNTSPAAFCPVYVVQASTFGGSANSDIPVCLAYDQSHYEALVPDTNEDIQKSIELKDQYIRGEYSVRMKDIPALRAKISVNKENFSYASIVKRKNTNQCDTSVFVDNQTSSSQTSMSSNLKIDIPAERNNFEQVESYFPLNQSKSPRVAKIQSDSPLKIPISKDSINQAECLTLEKLQLIKPKLRTEEEKKQLRHLKYISKKESLTVKEKESIKQKDQKRKQQERETLCEKEKENSRQKEKDRYKQAWGKLNIK